MLLEEYRGRTLHEGRPMQEVKRRAKMERWRLRALGRCGQDCLVDEVFGASLRDRRCCLERLL